MHGHLNCIRILLLTGNTSVREAHFNPRYSDRGVLSGLELVTFLPWQTGVSCAVKFLSLQVSCKMPSPGLPAPVPCSVTDVQRREQCLHSQCHGIPAAARVGTPGCTVLPGLTFLHGMDTPVSKCRDITAEQEKRREQKKHLEVQQLPCLPARNTG